ncbi:IclR family transcriptional regulator [Heyndrickxia coagulans]|uniref:IclR family transcriptional regulator n=1 Tax=Heyndrickxia coagulans TaxID=1398 RepID=UPI0023E42305|nr:IclR family transcriptional regulator C-terminal domain-containing protein [Heyndrickxia coagulans]
MIALIRYSRIRKRIPLHSTAVGKVMLAFQSPEEIERLLKDYQFTQHTANTITDKETLLRGKKVRQQGYAVDNQENEQGMRCIAVPIRDFDNKVIAAISISTLVSRVNVRELERYIHLLMRKGSELSGEWGLHCLQAYINDSRGLLKK